MLAALGCKVNSRQITLALQVQSLEVATPEVNVLETQSTAILWPRWCHLGAMFGDFGASFGDLEAVLKAIWNHFRPCYFGILNSNPNYTSKTLSPVAVAIQKNKHKKPIKNQNLLQNANLHANTGKTSPNIHPKSTFKTLSPMALQLQPRSRQPKNLAPLSRAL